MNYQRFDSYYRELLDDIYPQPINFNKYDEHFFRSKRIIKWLMCIINPSSVLDVGCGEAFCQDLFTVYPNINIYLGITLGRDYDVALSRGKNVLSMDFNDLKWNDNSFDLIFARHVLEHSPFPLITLMEWHRVARRWLCLIMPNPETATYFGRNHYYVVGHPSQIRWLLRRAGWRVIRRYYNKWEYCFICEKLPRIGYEGWAEIPLNYNFMQQEREDKEGKWR